MCVCVDGCVNAAIATEIIPKATRSGYRPVCARIHVRYRLSPLEEKFIHEEAGDCTYYFIGIAVLWHLTLRVVVFSVSQTSCI